MHRKSIRATLNRAALVAGAIGPMAAAVAQDASPPTVIEIEQLVVTGTRVADRSAIETAVPVDVVSGETLSNVGETEIIKRCLPCCRRSTSRGPVSPTARTRSGRRRCAGSRRTRLVMLNSKRRHARRS